MFKKIISLSICILLISTSFVLAEDVYKTKSGKTYHSEECRWIANRDTVAIPIEDAEAKNLRACKRCIAKPQAKASTKENKLINKEDAVYITKSGKKFHRQDCRLIKNKDKNAISLEDAQAKKMSPCKKCFAEEIAKAE